MKRLSRQARLSQLIGHHLGRVLGRHKHQHPAPAALGNQVAQQLGAPGGVHFNHLLSDGRDVQHHGGHFHPRRVVQQPSGQRQHRWRQGGREKQVLPARRQQRQNALKLLLKAQVQQAVGLVQHQGLHSRQLQRVVLDQVQQAPGGGDHDVSATSQTHHLRVDGHAAKHHRDFDWLRLMPGQHPRHLADLHGELTRRHQNQGPHPSLPARWRCLVFCQGLQQGQTKRQRLARACFGRDQHVTPGQHQGHSLGLHRRGCVKALIGQCAK